MVPTDTLESMVLAIYVPGLVFLAFYGFAVAAGVCLAYAVGVDADNRGSNGLAWGLFTLIVFPIAVPAYLVYRTRLPDRTDEPSRTERWIGSVGIGVTGAWFLVTALLPPDPFTLLLFTPLAALVLVPLSLYFCYGAGVGRPHA